MPNREHHAAPLEARIAALVRAGRPYLILAIPGEQSPAEAFAGPGLSATFMVDAGCAADTLNDPYLTGYVGQHVPIVFACKRKVDRQKLLDRRANFAARGYRLWQEDAHPQGRA
ncbi:hypothetical protein [Azospirillum brasilense]|uniref:hypothetical protein n=1 Tax=Azospirillum brasilense TaxID=192 RepID=UPI000E0B0D95|nr:hypothetical protein [Azospirillum brasilense]